MVKYIKNIFGEKIVFKVNKDKLIHTINTKWKTKMCPMCGMNNWTINDEIVTTINIDDEKNMQIGGRFSPLITVTCLNCGNVIFINPLVINAIDASEEDE